MGKRRRRVVSIRIAFGVIATLVLVAAIGLIPHMNRQAVGPANRVRAALAHERRRIRLGAPANVTTNLRWR